MAVDAMRVRVQVQKLLVVSIRICYRSVCKHPFLVGVVCFLVFLYRSFPFLFSLLVSASPVLVCTAILLGTLLSFGEPNIPEIEKEREEEEVEEEEKEEEEEVSHEISSLKVPGALEDSTVVLNDIDGSLFVDRFTGLRTDTEERAVKEESMQENGIDKKIEDDDGLHDDNENSRQIHSESEVCDGKEQEFFNFELQKKSETCQEKPGAKEVLSQGEAVENHYSPAQSVKDENIEMKDGNCSSELAGADKGDSLDFWPDSWKRIEDDDKKLAEDEETSDSGSEGAESSSPDASMADIIPMLDELHPLLDEEAPKLTHMSHDGSDAGSERSHKSSESSVESDDDLENQGDEEADGDDEHDNEDEAPGGKEDESKSAIKWTEDDQKNLMDLGTLELERNQRLESLIARRRARRNLRLMAEKNLIDFDDADIPINVPPISTARRNPFDLPYDDIPGSAPSILLPRRNPFDLPYDSNEEKPDLKGDSFQQEFSSHEIREPLFRRHESFSSGPSTFGGSRQHGRHDLRWKPYFVPERFATEGTGFPTFQRQLSEASESKVSSVPDTESLSSTVEEDDKKLNEEDNYHELMSNVDGASLLVERGSLLSEDVDCVDAEPVDRRDVNHDGIVIIFGDVENHHEIGHGLSGSGATSPVELNANEILLRMGVGGEEYSSRSSVSSMSEIHEKLLDLQTESSTLKSTNGQIEGSHISTQTSLDSDFHFMTSPMHEGHHRQPVLKMGGNDIRESGILMQTSVDSDFQSLSRMARDGHNMESVSESTGDAGDSDILKHSSVESDWQFRSRAADSQEPALDLKGDFVGESGISTQTSLKSNLHLADAVMPENRHKEPVYDSSPPPVEKLFIVSSVSSDTQGKSDIGSNPALAEFSDKDSRVHTESMNNDNSGYKENLEGSSQVHVQNENEGKSSEIAEISKHDNTKFELSEAFPDGQNGFMRSEFAVGHGLEKSSLSLPDNGVKVSAVCNKDAEIIPGPNKDAIEKLDSASSTHLEALEATDLLSLEEQHPPEMVEHVSTDMKLCPPEAKPVKEHPTIVEETIELEKEQSHLSTSDADIKVNVSHAVNDKLDLVASSSEHTSSNNLTSGACEEREPVGLPEQVPETHSDTRPVEDHSLREKEVSEQDHMHLLTSHPATGDAIRPDIDVKVVSAESSHQHLLSKENPTSKKPELSWSDKSMVEPSFNDQIKLQETSTSQAGTNSEDTILRSSASMTSDSSTGSPESVDYRTPYPEDKNLAFLTTDSTSSGSPPSEEYKSPPAEEDVKADILDKVVYEDSGNSSLEHPNSGEAGGSHGVGENNCEEEDEIKEIDEGLLSELDTVGDFGVREVGVSFHDKEMPEDTDCQSSQVDNLPKDLELTEIKPNLPVLEVRSVEDIDLAFQQLREGANVEEVILPSMIEDQQLVGDQTQHSGVTNSHFEIVEARSLDDIHSAMQQVSQGSREELLDSKDLCAEVNVVGTPEELPVLEVRTIEDVDLALKQQPEGVEPERIALPSTTDQEQYLHELRAPVKTVSDLPAVEARSLENIPAATLQVGEDNHEEKRPLDSTNKHAEEVEMPSVKENDLRTSPVIETVSTGDIEPSTSLAVAAGPKESESSARESDVQETSSSQSHEVKHDVDKTSSSSSKSGRKGRKKKSHSSSSSSSSSSSDSD